MRTTCALVDLVGITKRVPLRKNSSALQSHISGMPDSQDPSPGETPTPSPKEPPASATDVISELLDALQKKRRLQDNPDGTPAAAGQHAYDCPPLADAPAEEPAPAEQPAAADAPTDTATPRPASQMEDPADIVAQLERIAGGKKGVLAPAAKKGALKRPAAALKKPAAVETKVSTPSKVTPMKGTPTAKKTPPKGPKLKLGCSKCKWSSCSLCKQKAGLL